MKLLKRNKVVLLLLAATFLVNFYAHWEGFISPYVINDDVRQQVYWMQSWQDPELYQDHYLTDYSKQYVPWGVQAIYWGASHFINPVQFSKILTVMLFMATSGLLFVLASRLGDKLSGVVTVCVFFYFGSFLGSISGGLSRGFVFPLLILYLVFQFRNEIKWAGIVLLIQSFVNPYLFVLCFSTHAVFLAHRWWSWRSYDPDVMKKTGDFGQRQPTRPISITRLLFYQLPVLIGVLLVVAKYRFFNNPAFGELVSMSEMTGHLEYTSAGRVGIIPIPSIFFEFIRPFILNLPVGFLSIFAYVAGVAILLYILFSGWDNYKVAQSIRSARPFIYLLLASVSLYVFSRLIMLDLFLPRRYLEYSLALFYCVLAGQMVRSAIESTRIDKKIVLLSGILIILGGLRLHGAGMYDYREHTPIYQFLQTTPKNSNIAGPPELMDNVMTFSRRKALVTYELSHTWYKQYWSEIKKRTYDFFNAYYSENPKEIRQFCRKYNINYLVVRESDFSKKESGEESIYFEPFNEHIQKLKVQRSQFALLDEQIFSPIYRHNGVRVLAPLN